jgi:hypothetical protein
MSVLVGGAVLASAATATLIGVTTDVTLANAAAPLVWSDVYQLPTGSPLLTNGWDLTSSSIYTDNSGKIWGVGNILKTYYDATGTNPIAVSSWYMTVKGTITASTMDVPTVKMTITGSGYIAPGTNAVLVVPGSSASTFPGKLSLTFSSNTKPVDGIITGTLKGSITPASKNAKTTQVNETAYLTVDHISISSVAERIIASGNQFNAISFFGGTATTGTGTVNPNTGAYKLTLAPLAGGGSSITATGKVGALISAGGIVTVNTADITGKIEGQAVKSAASWVAQ